MSASPIARQCVSHSQVIPTKKVVIHDANQLPDVYSSTPNGTLFSTTPGGKFSIFLFIPNLYDINFIHPLFSGCSFNSTTEKSCFFYFYPLLRWHCSFLWLCLYVMRMTQYRTRWKTFDFCHTHKQTRHIHQFAQCLCEIRCVE